MISALHTYYSEKKLNPETVIIHRIFTSKSSNKYLRFCEVTYVTDTTSNLSDVYMLHISK